MLLSRMQRDWLVSTRVAGASCRRTATSSLGAGNIQAFWQGLFDRGIKGVVLETIDLEAHGDTAIETGYFTLQADGGAIADRGKIAM